MKNLMILMVLVSTMVFTACGQKKKVPEKVKTAFAQKFPNVQKVSWDRENANEWEAEFKMNGKNYSANFDNNGKWKETEYEIKNNEIPVAVKATLNKDFAGYKVTESEISETAKGKVFEFQIKKSGEKMEVAILPNGKIIKKESANREKNEEGDEEKDND